MRQSVLKLNKVRIEFLPAHHKAEINWEIFSEEVWVVTGKNGSGKTLLGETISGIRNPEEGSVCFNFTKNQNYKGIEKTQAENIRFIRFDSVFSLADFRGAYYQERFNALGTDDYPLVSHVFEGIDSFGNDVLKIFNSFGLQKLLSRKINQLSSGELRKLLIIKMVLENPAMLIFDNPYSGLDNASRQHLDEIFPFLVEHEIQLLFLIPTGTTFPPLVTHTTLLESGLLHKVTTTRLENKPSEKQLLKPVNWNFFPQKPAPENQIIVKMENIEISYGQNSILKNINWTIRAGENWALLGPNGSGKSSLLSFVYADNPRSYNGGLRLFGKKRGSGESIWDIKKHIGFTSSEMHLYYRKKATCIEVVESGLFDSVGLYKKCFGEQKHLSDYVLELFGMEGFRNFLFTDLSTGHQKLILLARALIKNPDLLVLDEPFQGLDEENKALCRSIIDSYAAQPYKTLIFVTHESAELPACVDRLFELG